MSTSRTHASPGRLLLPALAALALAVAAGASAAASTDRQLARALIVAAGDGLPSSWTIRGFHNDARGKCLTHSRPTVTARLRDGFSDPNSGMWSAGTVLKTKSDASRYYARLVSALPRCLRATVRHHPVDANWVGAAKRLGFRAYGEQSAAWRLRASYQGNPFHYDWVVVRTGRAVLVDVFVLEADGGRVIDEEQIVRHALRRAS